MTEFGDKGDGITRRDFLDGVAITAAGLAAAAAAPHLTGAEALAASRGHCAVRRCRAGYYPPTGTGLKGQSDDVVARHHADRRPAEPARRPLDQGRPGHPRPPRASTPTRPTTA